MLTLPVAIATLTIGSGVPRLDGQSMHSGDFGSCGRSDNTWAAQ